MFAHVGIAKMAFRNAHYVVHPLPKKFGSIDPSNDTICLQFVRGGGRFLKATKTDLSRILWPLQDYISPI